MSAQGADFNRYREALAERMNIPDAPAGNAARNGLGGWRRAVRATVGWARDRDD